MSGGDISRLSRGLIIPLVTSTEASTSPLFALRDHPAPFTMSDTSPQTPRAAGAPPALPLEFATLMQTVQTLQADSDELKTVKQELAALKTENDALKSKLEAAEAAVVEVGTRYTPSREPTDLPPFQEMEEIRTVPELLRAHQQVVDTFVDHRRRLGESLDVGAVKMRFVGGLGPVYFDAANRALGSQRVFLERLQEVYTAYEVGFGSCYAVNAGKRHLLVACRDEDDCFFPMILLNGAPAIVRVGEGRAAFVEDEDVMEAEDTGVPDESKDTDAASPGDQNWDVLEIVDVTR